MFENKDKFPAHILPKDFQDMDPKDYLLKLDPLEIARQETLLDFALFNAVQPKECLGRKKRILERKLSHSIFSFKKI